MFKVDCELVCSDGGVRKMVCGVLGSNYVVGIYVVL